MLKKRTIAMLVAGCLVGAQAGIAANEDEVTALDTGYIVPIEQVVVLEPVDQFVVMDLTPAEAEMLSEGNQFVMVETTPVYIAAADTAYQPVDRTVSDRTVSLQAANRSAPAQRSYTAFKGHPSSGVEIAGMSVESNFSSQHVAHANTNTWGNKSAGAFPMNAPELAGIEAQTLEKQRLAQSSFDVRLASAAPVQIGRTE